MKQIIANTILTIRNIVAPFMFFICSYNSDLDSMLSFVALGCITEDCHVLFS